MARKPQADDKTAGSSARMNPGEEGRGGHRVQRRPIIEGELKGDLKKLAEQAETVAEFLGHATALWRTQPEENTAILRCRKCEATSGIALFPMKGREKINGTLFEEKCKR